MSDPVTIELSTLLSEKTLERLQAKAQRQQTAITALVREAIEEYLEDVEEELEDTPDEKILADLKEAWHEAMTGQTIPAEEALKALRERLAREQRQG